MTLEIEVTTFYINTLGQSRWLKLASACRLEERVLHKMTYGLEVRILALAMVNEHGIVKTSRFTKIGRTSIWRLIVLTMYTTIS